MTPLAWAGAGFAAAILAALAIITSLDQRYITRLEYRATMDSINKELKRIGHDHGRTGGGD